MRIFLVRHGESEANVDKTVNCRLADHKIPLSEKGILQAEEAALKLKNFLENENENRIMHPTHRDAFKGALWISPYLRTRQTAEPFKKIHWKNVYTDYSIFAPKFVKEDVALIEQQFGLFDGLSDEELKERYPNEHAYYDKCMRHEGRFYAKMPLGESRLDVTLRVHQLFGTWHRDTAKHGIDNLVVVSHGVTIRAIVMRWLHLSVEWFEQEKNPANCSIRVIDNGRDLGYL